MDKVNRFHDIYNHKRYMEISKLTGLSRHRIGVDGAGVTTLVAFHNCPLNCKYFLNPQALSPDGVWKKFSPEGLFKEIKKG